jgi:crotonobetainyl-CoA:carnitine CoA-transferase CaiB-like acyl-CoA transferase
VLGDESLARDDRLKSNQVRVENRDHVDTLINSAFSQLDQLQVVERLQRAGIAYGRLNDISGLSGHPEVVAVAAMFSGDQPVIRKVPQIGEHSQKIREEFS